MSNRLGGEQGMCMVLPAVFSVVIVVVSLAVGLISRRFIKEPDNPIEEIAEEVIKKEIGIDIDLSPDSPEDKESK